MSICDEVNYIRIIGAKASKSENMDIRLLAASIYSVADMLNSVCEYLDAREVKPLVNELAAAVDSGNVPNVSSALSVIKAKAQSYGRLLQFRLASLATRILASLSLATFSFLLILVAVTPLEFEVAPIILGLSISAGALYARPAADALLIVASAILMVTGAGSSLIVALITMAASVGNLLITIMASSGGLTIKAFK